MADCPECGAGNPDDAFTCGTCGGFLPVGGPAVEAEPGPPPPSGDAATGDAPSGAPSEWSPDMAEETPSPGTAPQQAYIPPTKMESSSKKVIWAIAAGVGLLVIIGVVLFVVMSGGSGDPDEAIQLVKEYEENQGFYDIDMFKDWEASGPADDMKVTALFDISYIGEEYSDVSGGYYQQKFEWKVNLETREVTPLVFGEELPTGFP
jgi:hypothetical protein